MGTGPLLPPPNRDLDTHDEIEQLVRRFYADVAQDDVLGPMFNDVAQVDWPEHLSTLTMFWARALLGIQGYRGNPFRAHTHIHRLEAFTPAHFRRWLQLFNETVDLGWCGPKAEQAKTLAANVARVHCGQLTGEAVGIVTADEVNAD